MSLEENFNCENCKFIEVIDGVQQGCAINKLDRFKKYAQANLNINNVYNFTKSCIYKRYNDWNGNLEEETKLFMNYIFVLRDFSNLNTLKQRVEQIKKYNPEWIGIIHNNKEHHFEIIDMMNSIGNYKFNIILETEEIIDFYKIDRFAKNIPKGWTVINVVEDVFNPDVYDLIDKAINEKLKSPIVVMDDKKSINNLCFFNYVYKKLQGSLPILDKEKDVIIYLSFPEKVEIMVGSDAILTWEQIND